MIKNTHILFFHLLNRTSVKKWYLKLLVLNIKSMKTYENLLFNRKKKGVTEFKY